MLSDKIERLKEELRIEEQKMRNCKHVFGKHFFNPKNVREAYGFKMIGHGSDVWTEPEGYHDVQKPQWTRKCTLCGYEEHTDKEKPIIVGNEPDFK